MVAGEATRAARIAGIAAAAATAIMSDGHSSAPAPSLFGGPYLVFISSNLLSNFPRQRCAVLVD